MSVFVSSHTSVCVLPDGVAPLSAAVFCFHTLHTGCSTCRSHSCVKTVWKDKAQRRCASPGVLWLREAVMPITAPAGPPITERRAHAVARPEKTSKQDNNQQPSSNRRVILSSERFPVTLFKRQIKTHQPSPAISKYNSVFSSAERQISSNLAAREWEASADWRGGGAQHVSVYGSLTGLGTAWRVIFGCIVAQHQEKSMASPQGRQACGIEQVLRSVWTHFPFQAVAPSLSPLRHLPHSRPWQLDTLTAAAEWQLICTNFKPYKSTCHNKSIKELGPSR